MHVDEASVAPPTSLLQLFLTAAAAAAAAIHLPGISPFWLLREKVSRDWSKR